MLAALSIRSHALWPPVHCGSVELDLVHLDSCALCCIFAACGFRLQAVFMSAQCMFVLSPGLKGQWLPQVHKDTNPEKRKHIEGV